MEKRTKKIIIISVSLLAIGGVAYWLWWRNKPKTDGSTDVPLATDDSGSSSPLSTLALPKGDGPSDVKAFQDWMDINRPNWVNGKNLNKGRGYGTYGPSTQKAWASYKAEYQKGSSPKPIASRRVTASYFTDPSQMIGKKVYSAVPKPLYNFSNTQVGTTKKGEYVGIVKTVTRAKVGTYWDLSVASPLGGVYKITSGGLEFLI
jgi:hypothetical protein